MLDSEHLDCVCICLPPVLHCDCACKALDHKIHVIVEKPMALSVELCDCMIESAKKITAVLQLFAKIVLRQLI